jgi:hypothetical protein
MIGGSKKEREERALDALLVTTLRRVEKDDEIIHPDKLPQLTEEEKAAMSELGGDFIKRILAGERPLAAKSKKTKDCPQETEEPVLEASGADCSFNRAEVIDDATSEEINEQEREVLRRRAEREQSKASGESAS